MSCQKSTFEFCSNNILHSQENKALSFWVRGDHIAGPFDMFSIRNCIALLSLTIPDPPPSASISRTICPFATPPIAGLQLIWAIVFMFMVNNKTLLPIFAAAFAASQPACPAPTTITSYLSNMCFVSRETRLSFLYLIRLFHVKQIFLGIEPP